ncbi:MAG: hypothetical protein V7641_819 [Blastocatellia bacterium]
MAVVSKTLRKVQFGVETTPGTGVAASKLLDTFEMTVEAQGDSTLYKPLGQKFVTTQVAPGKRMVQASFNAPATYTQMVYPLSSVFRTATITTPGGGTNSRKWLFDVTANSADTWKTFTIEQGDTDRAQKFAYGHCNDLKIEFSKQEIKISGTFMGQEIADDITMTGSPTTIAIVPITPQSVTVKLADTQAGLTGASALAIDVAASFSIGNRFKPQHRLDGTTTFSSIVEQAPDCALSLVLDADDTGYGGPLAKLTSGAQQFVRISATGATIEAAIPYTFNLDFCGAVKSYPKSGDSEGALTAEWEFAAFKDATWGKAVELYLINTLTAL